MYFSEAFGVAFLTFIALGTLEIVFFQGRAWNPVRLWWASLVQPLSSLFYFPLVNVIPGMCPIGFLKVMFSRSPIFRKSGPREGA